LAESFEYEFCDAVSADLGGLGIAIISTSRGVLKDADCRRHKAGGELLCNVW